MHIVGIMFFLTILALSFGTILMVVFEYKDRIIGALLDSEMPSHDNVVLISLRPNQARLPRVKLASNQDFSLPLAA